MNLARRRRLIKTLLVGMAYSVVLASALTVGTFMGWISQSDVARETLSIALSKESPQDAFKKSSITLLILGCDEDRAPGGRVVRENARSDMIMVAKLDFDRNLVTGLSIPRDTIVRGQKVNAFHAIGGKEKSQEVIEDMLGIKIDRTIVINYQAFQDMVDLVGGVEIYVPRAMRYRDRRGDLNIDIKPGLQKLDGNDSLDFVRYRRGDSDFVRQERQKEFMLAFKEEIKQHASAAPQLAQKAVELTDNVFTAREMGHLILFGQRVGAENVKMGMLPITEGPGYAINVDRSKLRDALIEFRLIEGEALSQR